MSSDTAQAPSAPPQLLASVPEPQSLTFSLHGRPILVVTREGDLIKGAGYEASGLEFFADLQRCINDCIAAHRWRAEQAEAELARLKHLMH